MARRRGERDERDGGSELIDKLTHINRVSKVVKGGRRFGFAALVVVGDRRGRVGFGHGKAKEVPEAIRKATEDAKRSLISVPLYEGRTLHHDVAGRWGAGRVILRAAPPGTGIIAGGTARAVFETLGIEDVVAKSIGSSNPYNVVRACFAALQKECSPRMVAARRGKKTSQIITRARRRAAAEAGQGKDGAGRNGRSGNEKNGASGKADAPAVTSETVAVPTESVADKAGQTAASPAGGALKDEVGVAASEKTAAPAAGGAGSEAA